MVKRKETEKDIQRTILEWLGYNRYFAWRNNTGAFVRDSHFYRFGDKGSPDIFVVVPKFEKHINTTARKAFCGPNCVFGQIYGIEIKSLSGVMSEAQERWQKGFEKAGGKYVLARSVEDVQRALYVDNS